MFRKGRISRATEKRSMRLEGGRRPRFFFSRRRFVTQCGLSADRRMTDGGCNRRNRWVSEEAGVEGSYRRCVSMCVATAPGSCSARGRFDLGSTLLTSLRRFRILWCRHCYRIMKKRHLRSTPCSSNDGVCLWSHGSTRRNYEPATTTTTTTTTTILGVLFCSPPFVLFAY